jgi:Icc protein
MQDVARNEWGCEFDKRLAIEVRVIQLTDTHIFSHPDGRFDGVDTLSSLRAVVALVRRCHWPPQAMVMTGDLVHEETAEAYQHCREVATGLDVGVYCIPGNHDDPTLMKQVLAMGNVHVVHETSSIRIGSWTLVFLNTHVPGREGGHLRDADLQSLAACLSANAGSHVLVCLHHHPVRIDSAWMDAMALDNADELFNVLDRHDLVRAIIWGHIHQEFSSFRRGVRLLGSPSTCVQFRPKSDGYVKDTLSAGYRWLVLREDGKVRSGIKRLP